MYVGREGRGGTVEMTMMREEKVIVKGEERGDVRPEGEERKNGRKEWRRGGQGEDRKERGGREGNRRVKV